jgi:site-specific recombinase XerC
VHLLELSKYKKIYFAKRLKFFKGQPMSSPGGLKMANSRRVNLEMVARFQLWLTAQKYSPSTHERYCRIARKLCRHIGKQSLSTVTPMDVGDFLTATLPDRWADNYIAHQLGALRCFFDFLYLGGVVDNVAPRFLKARARPKALPKAITQAQVRKMIRMAEHPRDRALLEFLYSTGCRIGEVRNLRVENVDFKSRTILVKGKRRARCLLWGTRRKGTETLPWPPKDGLFIPGQDQAAEGLPHLLQKGVDWKLERLPSRFKTWAKTLQVARESSHHVTRAGSEDIPGISQG